jgi:hypothetical protein
MKVLLDIKDDKAPHLIEVLKDLPYVKIKFLTHHQSKIIEDVHQAVEEMQLITQGELKARKADKLFNEL